MRKIRFIRHIVLFFAVGFSWGYVTKIFANNFLYIGYNDPQIESQAYDYKIKSLTDASAIDVDDSLAQQASKATRDSADNQSSQDPRSTSEAQKQVTQPPGELEPEPTTEQGSRVQI